MTYGSEPRRRRWSSDSSRRENEQDDAENWLAGIRPDPSGDDRLDAFRSPSGSDPAADGTTGRHGRRRRAEGFPEDGPPPATFAPAPPPAPATLAPAPPPAPTG